MAFYYIDTTFQPRKSNIFLILLNFNILQVVMPQEKHTKYIGFKKFDFQGFYFNEKSMCYSCGVLNKLSSNFLSQMPLKCNDYFKTIVIDKEKYCFLSYPSSVTHYAFQAKISDFSLVPYDLCPLWSLIKLQIKRYITENDVKGALLFIFILLKSLKSSCSFFK